MDTDAKLRELRETVKGWGDEADRKWRRESDPWYGGQDSAYERVIDEIDRMLQGGNVATPERAQETP